MRGKKEQTLTWGAAESAVSDGGVLQRVYFRGEERAATEPLPAQQPLPHQQGAEQGPADPPTIPVKPWLPAHRPPAAPGAAKTTPVPTSGWGVPLLGHRTVKQKFAGTEVAHCLEAHFLFFHL